MSAPSLTQPTLLEMAVSRPTVEVPEDLKVGNPSVGGAGSSGFQGSVKLRPIMVDNAFLSNCHAGMAKAPRSPFLDGGRMTRPTSHTDRRPQDR